MCRRCGEPDRRSNAAGRRRRRQWLLSAESGHGGDGDTVNCWNVAVCGQYVTNATMHIDRIIPGWEGGSYRRDNIRPSCAPCNLRRNAGNPWARGQETRCLTS